MDSISNNHNFHLILLALESQGYRYSLEIWTNAARCLNLNDVLCLVIVSHNQANPDHKSLGCPSG